MADTPETNIRDLLRECVAAEVPDVPGLDYVMVQMPRDVYEAARKAVGLEKPDVLVFPGVYEDYYKCRKCGVRYMVRHDDVSTPHVCATGTENNGH